MLVVGADEPKLAVVGDVEGDVRTIWPRVRAGDWRVNSYIMEAAEPGQLIDHDLTLECKLRRVVNMLPLAAAAFTRPKVRAARLNTRIGAFQQRDSFCVGEAPFI